MPRGLGPPPAKKPCGAGPAKRLERRLEAGDWRGYWRLKESLDTSICVCVGFSCVFYSSFTG